MKDMKDIKDIKYIKRLFLSALMFVIIGIMINAVAFSDLWNHKIEVASGTQYREMEEYMFPDTLMNEEDVIIQYFTPKRHGLNRIEIRLAFNHTTLLEQYGGKIALRIKDEKQAILQEEILSSEEIPNWRYYILEMDHELERGKTYAIELQQLEGPIDESTGKFILSYVPFVYPLEENGVQIKENGVCEYRGTEQNYKWDLYYVYECVDEDSMRQLITVDIFYVAIIVLLPWLIRRFWNKKWNYSYMVCLPLLQYGMVETITGNLSTIQPIYHVLNVVVIYIFCILVMLFFENVKIGLSIINIIFPVVALIEYYVYKLRGRSFMLQDVASIRTAGQVMGQYTYEFETRIGITLLVLAVLIYVLLWLPELRIEAWLKTRKVLVLSMVVGSISLLQSRDVMGKIPETQINQWDIEGNYQSKGYLFVLLSEMQYLKQEAPEGYSIDAVKEIANTYTKQYDERMGQKETAQAKNILVIMNESWADFRNIDSEFISVTPFIDALSENTIKGWLQVPVFGAGTSNSEYEVLTGNSMQFFGMVDSVYQLYTSGDEWGMASSAKLQGYHTVAMHPCISTNWNRNIVYPRMKFDEFYSEESWYGGEIEYIRWCASDGSCYDAVERLYEDKKEYEKLFSFVVTMQNHGGYDFAEYESTVELEYNVDYPKAEQYLSLVKESDNAFSELVDYFSEVDEETMIVMFGDHLPSVEEEFYQELLGQSMNTADLLLKQKLYQTPFVIWTNYDIEEEESVQISTNYFGSYIFEKAGVELTDYDKCRMSFYEEIPIIGMGMMMDKDGNWYQSEALPDNIKDMVEDYKIIQHNRVFGNRKRVDALFTLGK